jgi:hypothetical protein
MTGRTVDEVEAELAQAVAAQAEAERRVEELRKEHAALIDAHVEQILSAGEAQVFGSQSAVVALLRAAKLGSFRAQKSIRSFASKISPLVQPSGWTSFEPLGMVGRIDVPRGQVVRGGTVEELESAVRSWVATFGFGRDRVVFSVAPLVDGRTSTLVVEMGEATLLPGNQSGSLSTVLEYLAGTPSTEPTEQEARDAE